MSKMKNRTLWRCIGILLIVIVLFDCQVFAAGNNTGKSNGILEVSSFPVLQWEGYPDAVIYELQIAQKIDFSAESIVLHSTSVYASGYQPDLSRWLGSTLFYRIRPLDYDRHPIGPWNNMTTLSIAYPEDFSLFQPITTSKWSKVTPILYPVYSWIPVFGADRYRVEVFSVDKGAALPSEKRYHFLSSHDVGGSLTADWYDEISRVGNFAWRVQALDKEGNPIGRPSAYEEFSLKSVPRQFAIGVFGDSIMHGGGAVSGSPADYCYSLHAYLDAPAINLARSGDTSESSLQRFDKDVLPFLPRTLLILTGTNSIRGGQKAEKVIKELTAIYTKCRENKITPVFLTLPPINPERIELVFREKSAPSWPSELRKVNQYIISNLPHIDVAPLFADSDGKMPVKWSTDGLHPDSKAKKVIADQFNKSRFIR